MTIIEDLQAEELVNFPVSDYDSYDRIVETSTTRLDSQWWVGDALESGPQQEDNYLNRK